MISVAASLKHQESMQDSKGFQDMVAASKKMLFDLKLLEDANDRAAIDVKRAQMQGKDKLEVVDMDDFVGSGPSQVLDLEKELGVIPEEDSGSVKLGSDMLNVSDLAFKDFRERKQTMLSNFEQMADAKLGTDQDTK